MTRRVMLSFVVCSLACVNSLNGMQNSGARVEAHVVYVIRDGSQPRKDYLERLQSAATRAEKFFAKWMAHWKRPLERPQFFKRDSNGKVQVTMVKVRLPGGAKGRESLAPLRKRSIESARKKLKLKRNRRVVWWIFYDYPGVKGFRGGGNATTGGMAINAYPAGKGTIHQSAALAGKEVKGSQIKGAIHEFGHALGLPHHGPRMELKLGNSLMGPITPVFSKRTNSKDGRVYLNDATSAMIWKHPLLRKKVTRPVLPKQFKVSGLEVTEAENGKITVSGNLSSNIRAHAAIVFNTRTQKVGDYWSRSHTGTVAEDGKFSVSFWSPYSKGNLFLSFCLNNGTNTGNGKKRKSHIKISYEGKTGKRQFKLPAK